MFVKIVAGGGTVPLRVNLHRRILRVKIVVIARGSIVRPAELVNRPIQTPSYPTRGIVSQPERSNHVVPDPGKNQCSQGQDTG